ncbi:hypothetical protein ACVME8_002030 [Bradyrhizobium diazoefficiens]
MQHRITVRSGREIQNRNCRVLGCEASIPCNLKCRRNRKTDSQSSAWRLVHGQPCNRQLRTCEWSSIEHSYQQASPRLLPFEWLRRSLLLWPRNRKADDDAASVARRPLQTPLDTYLETPLDTVSMPLIQGGGLGMAKHSNGLTASFSHHFRHDVIGFVVFCFLSICDRLTGGGPEGLVVLGSSLVLANPAKPPAFIRQSRMKAGGGLRPDTGRHTIHHPRFSQICNDA